jgi:hypothetical protein
VIERKIYIKAVEKVVINKINEELRLSANNFKKVLRFQIKTIEMGIITYMYVMALTNNDRRSRVTNIDASLFSEPIWIKYGTIIDVPPITHKNTRLILRQAI